MLNSVGLQNPGVEAFIRDELPWLKAQGTVVIANLAGSCPEDYCAAAGKLSASDVDMIGVKHLLPEREGWRSAIRRNTERCQKKLPARYAATVQNR